MTTHRFICTNKSSPELKKEQCNKPPLFKEQLKGCDILKQSRIFRKTKSNSHNMFAFARCIYF